MRGITCVLTVLVLGLSACGSPAEPETLEPVGSTAPTATVQPSPTATASKPTPQASDPSESTESAATAMEAYFKAANLASTGRKIDEFRELFSESCAVCMTQYRNFSTAYAEGSTATGRLYDSWEVNVEEASENQALVMTKVSLGEIVLRDSSGAIIEVFPSQEGVTTVWTLGSGPDGWVVIAGTDLP